MPRKAPPKPPAKGATLRSLTAKRQKLQETLAISYLQRTQKLLESYYVEDFAASDPWSRTRGRNRTGRQVPPSHPGDRRGGRNFPLWETIQQLDDLRQNSRVACSANSFAKGLLKNLCNYTVGDGFQYQAVAKDQDKLKPGEQLHPDQEAGVGVLQQFVDGFLSRNRWSGNPDPLDTKAIAATREREAYRRLHRDGEVFIRLFFNADGSTDVRFVEPEQIRDPAGASYASGWSFGIRHYVDPETGWHDVERVEEYHVVYPDDHVGEDVPAAEIVHIKNIDEDAAITRGTPSFAWDTLDALERAAKVQRNSSISAAIRAATAEIWEHDFGSKADIEAMVTGLAAKQIEDPERSPNRLVNLEYIDPGSVRRVPQGQKLVQPPTTTGVPEHLQAAQGDLRQAGAAFAAPEYLISADASNANYASTKEAGTPFVVGSEAEQNHFLVGCLAVVYRAANHAREKTLLPGNIFKLARIQAEAPAIKQRDPLQQAQVDQIYNALGLSPQTILMAGGYDPDVEAQHSQEWKDRFGGPGGGLPLPEDKPPKPSSGFFGMESRELRRRLTRWLREAGEWDEGKHKREHGKFSKTGGAGGKGDDKAQYSTEELHAFINNINGNKELTWHIDDMSPQDVAKWDAAFDNPETSDRVPEPPGYDKRKEGGGAAPEKPKGMFGRAKAALSAFGSKVGGFLDKITDVPVARQVKGVFSGALKGIGKAQTALYGVMERRYGSKVAKGIFVAAQGTGSNPAIFPLWFVALPGSTLLAQLPLMGAAEIGLQATRGAKAVGRGIKRLFASEEQDQGLGSDEIKDLGKEVALKLQQELATWLKGNRKTVETALRKAPEGEALKPKG